MKMSSFMSVDFYKPTLPRHTCTDKKQTTVNLNMSCGMISLEMHQRWDITPVSRQ